jgi:hypothetical protein
VRNTPSGNARSFREVRQVVSDYQVVRQDRQNRPGAELNYSSDNLYQQYE